MNCPDGKPGWSDGNSDCHQSAVPTSTSPSSGLTFTLALNTTTVRTGVGLGGTATITNNGLTAVTFTRNQYTFEEALLRDANGDGASSMHGTDMYPNGESVTINSGAKYEFHVGVGIDKCGDTSHDGDQPLAPGTYNVVALLIWQTHDAVGTGVTDGTWLSEPVALTVTS